MLYVSSKKNVGMQRRFFHCTLSVNAPAGSVAEKTLEIRKLAVP